MRDKYPDVTLNFNILFMTTAFPRIILSNQPHRIERGHLWVYRNEIQEISGELNDGNIVDAFNFRGKFIARGYYNGNAMISFRALTRKPIEIDELFWRTRLQQAVNHRLSRYSERESYRLIHSDADFLPGLIVDRYADTLVLQTTTLGMDLRKPLFVKLLAEILTPKSILENNEGSSRELEKLPRIKGVLFGAGETIVRTRIGKTEFVCDLFDNHKTGFYLDQQQNYETVSGFVRPGMRILDGFCNLGGFAIHALLAGAKEATAVDSNENSIERTKESGNLAGVSSRLNFRVENMFDYLRAAQEAKEKFDFIILDPPSFSRSRKAVSEARRGYKEIHLRAFKILQPGGVLATFCCSHHVSSVMFLEFILEAAHDAHVLLRREAVLGASPDHPVIPSIPETEYLKGFVFTVMSE